ncbi:MAG: serine hydrolase [Flavobacteriales bacterium]|nr:serine hydrolase [Flavobacteriales bacterium]
MIRLIKFIGIFVLAIGMVCLILVVSGNGHIVNGIGKTYLVGNSRPDIDDMTFFDLREIAATDPQPWEEIDEKIVLNADQENSFTELNSTAFIVIKDGMIIAENYWPEENRLEYSNSFSMAKSFTGLCIGHAIDAGFIESYDQPLCDFVPQYCEGMDAEITIGHLLQMRSGIDFGESYFDPFGYQAKAYYGTQLQDATLEFHASRKPGSFWVYEGGNSVLLGMVLKVATGKSLSEYFAEHIWSPIGAEMPAYWNLDHDGGMEKPFSAVYSNARDFARVGQLCLDSGNWKGRQLVPKQFVEDLSTPVMVPDVTGEPYRYYGMHWWLGELDGHPFYSCRGMRGQYIVCLPHLNAVMVRLGHDRDENAHERGATLDLWDYLEITKDLIEQYEGRY